MDNGIRSMVLGLPRSAKRAIVMTVDAGLAVFSVWIAFYLRLGYFLPLFAEADGLSLLPAPLLWLFQRYLRIFGLTVIFRGATFWLSPRRSLFMVLFLPQHLPLSGSPVCRGRLVFTASRIVFICCVIRPGAFRLGGMYIERLRQSKPRALIWCR